MSSSVQDLGYKPYTGERLPPSNNTRVLFRDGLRRAWASWLVKLALFAGWLPLMVYLAAIGLRYYAANNSDMVQPMVTSEAATSINSLLYVQLWAFVMLISLGAGAGAISEDLAQKAFQFYFSKPVTRAQYLMGRVGAVAMLCFCVAGVPAMLLVVMSAGAAGEEWRLEILGLLLPVILHSLVIAYACAGASVGLSSISRSRAMTMSAWLFFFIVPHVVANIVHSVGDWPWLRLLALPSLVEALGDGMFEVPREDDIGWMHALPVLLALGTGGIALAYARLRRTEVIS